MAATVRTDGTSTKRWITNARSELWIGSEIVVDIPSGPKGSISRGSDLASDRRERFDCFESDFDFDM